MSAPTDYFADVAKTDLMRVTVALATEVYELRDRLHALEAVLAAAGQDLGVLESPVEPAAFDEERKTERDAFVARVFGALIRPGSG